MRTIELSRALKVMLEVWCLISFLSWNWASYHQRTHQTGNFQTLIATKVEGNDTLEGVQTKSRNLTCALSATVANFTALRALWICICASSITQGVRLREKKLRNNWFGLSKAAKSCLWNSFKRSICLRVPLKRRLWPLDMRSLISQTPKHHRTILIFRSNDCEIVSLKVNCKRHRRKNHVIIRHYL